MGNRDRQQLRDAASAKGFWSDKGVDEKQECAQAEGAEDPQRLLPAPGTSLHHTRTSSSAREGWEDWIQPQPLAVQLQNTRNVWSRPQTLKKKSSQPKAKHVASLYLLYGFEASWGHIFEQFSAATGVSGFVS